MKRFIKPHHEHIDFLLAYFMYFFLNWVLNGALLKSITSNKGGAKPPWAIKNFAPAGGPGSDIMEIFRQCGANSWVQDG